MCLYPLSLRSSLWSSDQYIIEDAFVYGIPAKQVEEDWQKLKSRGGTQAHSVSHNHTTPEHFSSEHFSSEQIILLQTAGMWHIVHTEQMLWIMFLPPFL